MTKDFKKKTKEKIKQLVKKMDLKLFTMKISFGKCTESDFESTCNLLLEVWRKMSTRHYSLIYNYFLGFTRELIFEIDGETLRPFLYILFFADKKKLANIMKLKSHSFLSVVKASCLLDMNRELTIQDIMNYCNVSFDEVPAELYDKVIDDLLLPCIRIIKENKQLEELVDTYQYNKQICSRSGIVSRKNLERNVSLER